MTDREVEASRATVAGMAAAAWRYGLLAAAAGAAAVPGALLAHERVAATLLGSALVLALAAGVRLRQRGGLLDRLALDPSAYVIPAVARHGDRAAGPDQRRRLASRLRGIAVGDPWGAIVLLDRVERFRAEIEQVTEGLAAPDAEVAPAQAVACRRLLTRCAESPLYNARVPAEDLGAALRRIAAGTRRPAC